MHVNLALKRQSQLLHKLTVAAAVVVSHISAPAFAQDHTRGDDSLRAFFFGHSLVNNNTPRTAVPYWMTQFANADNQPFDFAGRWGFMYQHADNLPPVSQWHFDGAASFWDHDTQSFGDADFNTAVLTVANFAQWLPPTEVADERYGSSVDQTLEVIDWLVAQEPGMDIYIYENWPDMATYIEDRQFPPNEAEFATYNAYTVGAFNDWNTTYYEALQAQRPDVNIIAIPVGQIISKLITDTTLMAGIGPTDLYIDDAPHGTPTLYFLASLITYAGMYETSPPLGINVPVSLHPVLRENYQEIAKFIATELGV